MSVCLCVALAFSMPKSLFAQDDDPIVSITPIWEYYWWPCYLGTLPQIFKNIRFSLDYERASGEKERKFIFSHVNTSLEWGEGVQFKSPFHNNYLITNTVATTNPPHYAAMTESTVVGGDEWTKCNTDERKGDIVISGDELYGYYYFSVPEITSTAYIRSTMTTDNSLKHAYDYGPLYQAIEANPGENYILFNQFRYGGIVAVKLNDGFRLPFFVELGMTVPKVVIWYDRHLYYEPDGDMQPTLIHTLEDIPHGKEYMIAKRLKASMTMDCFGLDKSAKMDLNIYVTPPTDPEKLALARENGWID